MQVAARDIQSMCLRYGSFGGFGAPVSPLRGLIMKKVCSGVALSAWCAFCLVELCRQVQLCRCVLLDWGGGAGRCGSWRRR